MTFSSLHVIYELYLEAVGATRSRIRFTHNKPRGTKMNTQINNAEIQAIIANQYREDGRKALLTARGALERAMQEMDRYLDRYEKAENTHEMADNLNWAINHLASSILPNARLDMLALAQAQLATLKK